MVGYGAYPSTTLGATAAELTYYLLLNREQGRGQNDAAQLIEKQN